MYSHAIGTLVLAFLVALVLASSMPSMMAQESEVEGPSEVEAPSPMVAQQSGLALSSNYDAEQRNWNFYAQYCVELNDEVDMAYKSQYRWAELCAPPGVDACHKCLVVTNPAASHNIAVTARVVDVCEPFNGLVMFLDKALFDEIDTDGPGSDDGRKWLEVNYEVIDCPDN